MSILIKATSVSIKDSALSGIANSARSARKLLDDTCTSDEDIDLLIHVGVFRDENISEPAIAALVQHEANIGLGRTPLGNQILSFDINNSSCGFLNAVDVAHSFFEVGHSANAVIVSGDYHPGNVLITDGSDDGALPYGSVGASVLVEYATEPGIGFGPVYVDCRYDDEDAAYVDFRLAGDNGRSSMIFVASGTLPERSTDMAVSLALQSIGDIDKSSVFLITAPYSADFARVVGAKIGLSDRAMSSTYREIRDPHTSALTLSYHDLDLEQVRGRFDHILFVSVGVGITAAAALYTLP
jgi:3-oxoacyl-[acyl-carrier-protein] synthase-3